MKISVPNIIGTVRLGEQGIEELTQLLQATYDKGVQDGERMPVNPHTGLYNVTPEEVDDARAATEDVILVREDGTLTKAGQLYVADVRRHIANGE